MSFLRNNIQKIIIGVLIIIVLAVVLLRGDQLQELVETMKGASIIPIIAAVVVKLAEYLFQSIAYHFTFKAVGEEMPQKATLPLVFGTFFMNTIAPSMNLAGTTLVVDEARRRGIDPGKSTSAALLFQITFDGSFATIMVISFTMLFFTVGLNWLWVLMGSVIILLVAGMISVLIIGKKQPNFMETVLTKIETLVNRVITKFKADPLQPWAKRVASNFTDAAGQVGDNKKYIIFAYIFNMIATTCELCCFCLVGISFEIWAPEPLICGFVVATLFAMISITPQGVGVVEAMIVLAFTMYGQNSAAATATGLVYRGIVFWMPFFTGAILMTRLKMFKGSTKKSVKTVVDTQEEFLDTGVVPLADYKTKNSKATNYSKSTKDSKKHSDLQSSKDSNESEILRHSKTSKNTKKSKNSNDSQSSKVTRESKNSNDLGKSKKDSEKNQDKSIEDIDEKIVETVVES